MERLRGTDPDTKPRIDRGTVDIPNQQEVLRPRPVRIMPPFVRIQRCTTPIEGPKPGGQS